MNEDTLMGHIGFLRLLKADQHPNPGQLPEEVLNLKYT